MLYETDTSPPVSGSPWNRNFQVEAVQAVIDGKPDAVAELGVQFNGSRHAGDVNLENFDDNGRTGNITQVGFAELHVDAADIARLPGGQRSEFAGKIHLAFKNREPWWRRSRYGSSERCYPALRW